jgi:uncharacterized protein with HEPN domain
MSDGSAREWRFYLDDMIGFAEKVIAYTDGLDQLGFVANGLNYDATVRNLELIGEAATRIPDAVRAANPQLPWRLVIATRNRLIHGCLGIDKAIMKQWAKREEQIERVMGVTVGLYGDLQAIADKSLREIDGRELQALGVDSA